jgi:hypothetical protein
MELACNKDVREPGRQLARFPQYCFKIEKPASTRHQSTAGAGQKS